MQISVSVAPVALAGFAVLTRSSAGGYTVLAHCHNRATAELLCSKYATRYKVATLVGAPGHPYHVDASDILA